MRCSDVSQKSSECREFKVVTMVANVLCAVVHWPLKECLVHNTVPDFQKFPLSVRGSEAEKNFLARQGGAPAAKVWTIGDDEPTRPAPAAPVPPVIVPPASLTAPTDIGSSGKWELATESGAGGIQLNAQSRVALMHRLAGSAGIAVPPMPVSMPAPEAFGAAAGAPPTAPTGVPSQCMVLRNMFSPEEERARAQAQDADADSDWTLDLQEDVVEECNRYGSGAASNVVQHVHVDANDPGGLVYVKFYSLEVALRAASALHGRWFASRLLTVAYMPREQYDAQFQL